MIPRELDEIYQKLLPDAVFLQSPHLTICLFPLPPLFFRRRFALKTFFRKNKSDEKQRKYYLNEIEILRSLDHPNVLRLFQSYEHNKNLHMVVELCSGGNLLRVLNNQPRRRVNEMQAAQFSMQILRAINYLHENDIVHRDVKLEVRAIAYFYSRPLLLHVLTQPFFFHLFFLHSPHPERHVGAAGRRCAD